MTSNSSADFAGNSMFNVHNSKSLAGFGFFPPLMYQAFANRCNPDINPIDGSRLVASGPKNDFRMLLYFFIGLLGVIVILL